MSWLDTLSEIRETDWSKASIEDRAAKAQEVVTICAYASAALSVVPFSDFVLLIPVHTVMVMTIGRIHDRKLSGAEAKRVVLELGAIAGVTFAGSAAINALRKILLPGLGSVVSVPATFALTWALGRVSIDYFANPSLSREDLKKLFEEAMKEGKASFSKEALDRFRQKNQDVKPEDVAGHAGTDAGAGTDAAAEPAKREPAEKVKPEPARTEPARTEPARTEPPRTEARPGAAAAQGGGAAPAPPSPAERTSPADRTSPPDRTSPADRTKPAPGNHEAEPADRVKTDPIPKKKRTL